MAYFIAYVDPGTGSFVLQGVVGAVMGVGYMIRGRVRLVLTKLRRKKTGEAIKSISE